MIVTQLSGFAFKYWCDSSKLAYLGRYANIERFINKVRQGIEVSSLTVFIIFVGIRLGPVLLLLLKVFIELLTSSGVVGDIINVSKFGDFKWPEKFFFCWGNIF